MDAHPRLDEVMAQRTLGQLQLEPFEAHRVVAADHALLLHAQRLGERCRIRHHEGGLRQRRRLGKARIVGREVDLADRERRPERAEVGYADFKRRFRG